MKRKMNKKPTKLHKKLIFFNFVEKFIRNSSNKRFFAQRKNILVYSVSVSDNWLQINMVVYRLYYTENYSDWKLVGEFTGETTFDEIQKLISLLRNERV